MKQKKIGKLLGLAGAVCLTAGMFFCPATVLPAQAAVPDVASPCSDIIEWRYKIEDGKIWQRLYNYSTRNWIGEWIYVGEYPEKGKKEY